MKVDLPEPEGPITATNSPGSIATEIPRNAGTVYPPRRYSLARSRVRMSGSAMGSLLKRQARPAAARGGAALRRFCGADDDLRSFRNLP